MNTLPSNLKHVYFIGIAGIGMSALARYFMHEGIAVSGYDRDRSALAVELENEGAEVHYEIDVGKIPAEIDMVVYTPAITGGHAELEELRTRGVAVFKRAEVLGMLSREKKCIAVAGTHGKTTTSAMIAFILRECGVECTALMGGIVSDFEGNFVYGEGDWIVVEADEFDRSFLHLTPEIAVVTAMDADHLDVYESFDEMAGSYIQFMGQVVDGGCVLMHADVMNAIPKLRADAFLKALSDREIGLIIYGETGHLELRHYEVEGGQVKFAFWNALDSHEWRTAHRMPGKHNVLNAIAALGVAHLLDATGHYHVDVTRQCALEAVSKFRGINRRFEFIYTSPSLNVIDDYAHHPNEISAAIEAARSFFKGKRITGVFQPHLYSRTKDFYKEFGHALSDLDEVILVEIYPARELPVKGVSSELIFNEVDSQFKYLTTKKELTGLLRSLEPEILLFMGAGDLDRMIVQIVENIIH